jgi:hypothetical protein
MCMLDVSLVAHKGSVTIFVDLIVFVVPIGDMQTKAILLCFIKKYLWLAEIGEQPEWMCPMGQK